MVSLVEIGCYLACYSDRSLLKPAFGICHFAAVVLGLICPLEAIALEPCPVYDDLSCVVLDYISDRETYIIVCEL